MCLARKLKLVEQLMKQEKKRCLQGINWLPISFTCVSKCLKVKEQTLYYFIEFCQNLQGSSIDRWNAFGERTKRKSFKIWKRKSFIEVLIANVYPVKNQKLIAVGYKICLATICGNKPILFSRSIETLETNDTFKHNLDLKEFNKQMLTQ